MTAEAAALDYGLIVLGGLLGSAHCLGMCGGFALAVGVPARSPWSNLRRQLAFALGRVFTYGVLGGLAAFGGLRLSAALGGWVNVSAIISIAAGLTLIGLGLRSAGVWPGVSGLGRRGSTGAAGALTTEAACLTAPILANFLKGGGLGTVLVAGTLHGLLPCGLVYGFLGLAAGTADPLRGPLVMLCFGFGTMPMMAAIGLGGGLLSPSTRVAVWRTAAWAVFACGVLALTRGVVFLTSDEACPVCVM